MDKDKIKKTIEEVLKRSKGQDVVAIPITLDDLPKDSRLLEAVNDVLGEMVDEINPKRRVSKCLPCVQKMFLDISTNTRGGDTLADAGFLAVDVLSVCLSHDAKSDTSDMSERLIVTLIKFCELTGLLEDKQLQKVIKKVLDNMNREGI